MLTNEQREKRYYGIGGSDLAIICGLSQYKTPYELYLEKRAPGDPIGELPVDAQSVAARIGSYLEPLILDIYEEDTNQKLAQRDTIETRYHPTVPYLFANVDGVLNNGALVEAKSMELFCKNQWGVSGTNSIPDAYLLQVAHYAVIWDAPYVDVVVLFGKASVMVYRYERDLKFEKNVMEVGVTFWEEHVLKQKPPEPLTMSDLRKLHPITDTMGSCVITFKIEEEINEFRTLKRIIKEATAEAEKKKFNICNFMGPKEILLNRDGEPLATYKPTKVSRTFLLRDVA